MADDMSLPTWTYSKVTRHFYVQMSPAQQPGAAGEPVVYLDLTKHDSSPKQPTAGPINGPNLLGTKPQCVSDHPMHINLRHMEASPCTYPGRLCPVVSPPTTVSMYEGDRLLGPTLPDNAHCSAA